MQKIIGRLLVTLLLGWSGAASADPVRYQLDFSGVSGSGGFQGAYAVYCYDLSGTGGSFDYDFDT